MKLETIVDQTIGPRELLHKVLAVIKKCVRFWYYKLWQLLLQIVKFTANLFENGNLHKKGQLLQTELLYYKLGQ